MPRPLTFLKEIIAMQINFNKSLDLVLKHEGGWSNHPSDPGGATMRGVTQRVYTGYRSRKGLPDRSVRSIELAELRDIYKRQYWDAVCGDDLPSGLDYAVFDYAVNSGPVRAARDLQRALGIKVDGHIGQSTIAAAMKLDTMTVVRKLQALRMAFLQSLKTFPVFGKGWTSRVNGVLLAADVMAARPHTVSPAVAVTPEPAPASDEGSEEVANSRTQKADEADIKVTKREGFFEKVIAGVTSGGAGVIAAMQGLDWRIGVALVVVAAVGATAYIVFHRSSGEEG